MLVLSLMSRVFKRAFFQTTKCHQQPGQTLDHVIDLSADIYHCYIFYCSSDRTPIANLPQPLTINTVLKLASLVSFRPNDIIGTESPELHKKDSKTLINNIVASNSGCNLVISMTGVEFWRVVLQINKHVIYPVYILFSA